MSQEPASTAPLRIVTELDRVRVLKLLPQEGEEDSPLAEMLAVADAVPGREVPADVVTMNSTVLVADEVGAEPLKLTLCYPDDADPAAGKVSVLSPMGTALLGLRAGATARWETPDGGQAQALVQKVLFQPEDSGDYLA